MSLNNFSVVFAGENFPISSIKTSDFVFRHRPLIETVRLPVLLQAAAGAASIDVLNERFIAAISAPDKVDVQISGIQDLARTFLEYVGKRTISATGHNLQFALDGIDSAREKISAHFVQGTAVREALGTENFTTDLQFGFEGQNGSRVRLAIVTEGTELPTVDFNFNFDAAKVAPEEALDHFKSSYLQAQNIVDTLTKAIQQEVSV